MLSAASIRGQPLNGVRRLFKQIRYVCFLKRSLTVLKVLWLLCQNTAIVWGRGLSSAAQHECFSFFFFTKLPFEANFNTVVKIFFCKKYLLYGMLPPLILHGAVRGFSTPCVDCGESSLQHQASLSAPVPPTFSSDCVPYPHTLSVYCVVKMCGQHTSWSSDWSSEL